MLCNSHNGVECHFAGVMAGLFGIGGGALIALRAWKLFAVKVSTI
jgi:hypothetical protein